MEAVANAEKQAQSSDNKDSQIETLTRQLEDAKSKDAQIEMLTKQLDDAKRNAVSFLSNWFFRLFTTPCKPPIGITKANVSQFRAALL